LVTTSNAAELRTIEVSAPMLQFLRWVADRDRTYEETMDAWRTSCPRLSVWEDASIGGLVRLADSEASGETLVVLTAGGRSIVDGVT
jgi:hypothetical protein